MMRKSILAMLAVLLVGLSRGTAAPTLEVARGRVEKVTKDTLVIQPRQSDGKFGKSLTLRVTGTTKISAVSLRKQGKKEVPVQRDAELGDLKPGQNVAIIYVAGADISVLLAAVVKPTSSK